MLLQKWVQHGRPVASRARTLLSSLMGRCSALPTRNSSRMSTAEKQMGACASCMVPAFTVVAPVRSASSATAKPRQVSVLLHPLVVGPAPLLWRDWSRREHRRACMQLVRDQQIEVRQAQSPPSQSSPGPPILSRAQRAHVRLSWTERVTRNASVSANGQVSLKLFGVPDQFADFLGLRAG